MGTTQLNLSIVYTELVYNIFVDRRKRGISFILGVLIIFGVLAVLVFVKQNLLRERNEIKNAKTAVQHNEFTNNISGYKFTYPKEWFVDSSDPTMVVLISPESSLVAGSSDYGNTIAIGSSYLSYPTTINNFFSFYSRTDYFKANPVSVNGLPATNFVANTDKYKGTDFIALTKNGKVFINFTYRGDEEHKTVYENLLSSFEFVDPVPAPSNSEHIFKYDIIGGVQPEYAISNWITYKNDQHKFQIDYPRLWERKVFPDTSNGTVLSVSFNPTFSSQRRHPPGFSLIIYSNKYKNINYYLTDQKYVIISRKNISINSTKGLLIERELKKSAMPIPPEKLWLVEKYNYLYVFSEGFSESNDNLWEKVLDSVIFLN